MSYSVPRLRMPCFSVVSINSIGHEHTGICTYPYNGKGEICLGRVTCPLLSERKKPTFWYLGSISYRGQIVALSYLIVTATRKEASLCKYGICGSEELTSAESLTVT